MLGASAPALFYTVFPEGLMRRVVETAQSNPGAPNDISLWTIDVDAFGAFAAAPTLVVDADEPRAVRKSPRCAVIAARSTRRAPLRG